MGFGCAGLPNENRFGKGENGVWEGVCCLCRSGWVVVVVSSTSATSELWRLLWVAVEVVAMVVVDIIQAEW